MVFGFCKYKGLDRKNVAVREGSFNQKPVYTYISSILITLEVKYFKQKALVQSSRAARGIISRNFYRDFLNFQSIFKIFSVISGKCFQVFARL